LPLLTKINDPALNEFLYSIVYNMSHIEKIRLPRQFRKVLGEEKSAQRFIANTSLEMKLEFLALAGVRWNLVFSGVANDVPQSVNKIIRDFSTKSKAQVLKDCAEQRFFFSADKHIIQAIGMLSQMTHSNQYRVNMAYIRSVYHLEGWDKKLQEPTTDNMYAAAEAAGRAAAILNKAISFYENCQNYDLTKCEVRVIIYMYQKLNAYVKEEDVFAHFVGHMAKGAVGRAIKRLHREYLLRKSATEDAYTITATGVAKVQLFLNQVTQE